MYVVGVGLVKVYKALIRRGLEKEMAIHTSVLALRIPGRRSLVGCCLWGCTGSDVTKATLAAAAAARCGWGHSPAPF